MPSPKEEFEAWQKLHNHYCNEAEAIFYRIRRKQYPNPKSSPTWGWEPVRFDDEGYMVFEYHQYGEHKEIVLPPCLLYDEEALERYIDTLEVLEKYAD